MEKTTWTRKEVSRITDIPTRRVLFYTEQPFLLPFVNKATGRGTAREYNIEDIFYLLLVKELDSLGLSLTRTRLVVQTIRSAAAQDDTTLPLLASMLPKLALWEKGTFTKTPIVVSIVTDNDQPDSVTMGLSTGETKVRIKADVSSQIILNLNLIFKKAKW